MKCSSKSFLFKRNRDLFDTAVIIHFILHHPNPPFFFFLPFLISPVEAQPFSLISRCEQHLESDSRLRRHLLRWRIEEIRRTSQQMAAAGETRARVRQDCYHCRQLGSIAAATGATMEEIHQKTQTKFDVQALRENSEFWGIILIQFDPTKAIQSCVSQQRFVIQKKSPREGGKKGIATSHSS